MIDLTSIYFGIFWGIFPFTIVKIIQQTRQIVARLRTFRNAYLCMIWVEAVANLIMAIITYLYLIGVVSGTSAFFAVTLSVWIIQTQLLPQIIANRVGLIMIDKRKAMWLKLGLFLAIGFINISVGVIWVTAQVPGATAKQIDLNIIYEKFEKAFILVVELGLNLFFLYEVWSRLIALGLDKYWLLFNVNVAVVLLSTAMDALLLGMLSLSNPYLYVQFIPVAYIVKLHLELTMASLIAKIVRKSNEGNISYPSPSTNRGQKNNTYYTKFPDPSTSSDIANQNDVRGPLFGNDTQINKAGDESDTQLAKYHGDSGIMRTVTTIVVTEVDKV